MKKLLSILAICLICSIELFAQEHIKVKNIPIDGKVPALMAKFKAAGLTPYKGYDDVLTGTFAGFDNCTFLFYGTDKTNTAYRITIMTDSYSSWYTLKVKYRALKESYIQKYPNYEDFEFFREPYYEGDGYELQALKNEKCVYSTFFDTEEGTISIELSSVSSQSGYIVIRYEDKINLSIAKSERQTTVSDDI